MIQLWKQILNGQAAFGEFGSSYILDPPKNSTVHRLIETKEAWSKCFDESKVVIRSI